MSIPDPPSDGNTYILSCKNGIKKWIKYGSSVQGKKYLIINAGQSNCMSSDKGPLDFLYDAAHPRIFQWSRGLDRDANGEPIPYNCGQKNEWIMAEHPLQHYQIFNKKSVGYGLTMAREFLQHLGVDDEIYILNCGMGGTGFEPVDFGWGKISWRKEFQGGLMNLYDTMMNDIKQVMLKTPDLEIKCITWQQGEADVGINQNYGQDLVNFITNIRTDLNNANIPFICGTMLKLFKDANPAGSHPIDHVHKNITSYAPYLTGSCVFDDLLGHEGDFTHYNADSQREIGRRFGKKLLEFK